MRSSPRSLALVAVLGAACSRTHMDTADPEPVMPSSDAPLMTPSNEPKELPPETDDAEPAPPEWTIADDEILGVLSTIHEGMLDTAKLAKRSARDLRVKLHADKVLAEHGAAKRRDKDLRRSLGLLARDSRLSDDIQADFERRRTLLKASDRGEPFDTAFIDAQIQSHTLFLDTIDLMLPHARAAEVRQELERVREALEGHLSAALDLQAALTADNT